MTKLTPQELLHIFVEITNGRGNHSHFLRSFAKAYVGADMQNALILEDAAISLVRKYELDRYLSNFEDYPV